MGYYGYRGRERSSSFGRVGRVAWRASLAAVIGAAFGYCVYTDSRDDVIKFTGTSNAKPTPNPNVGEATHPDESFGSAVTPTSLVTPTATPTPAVCSDGTIITIGANDTLANAIRRTFNITVWPSAELANTSAIKVDPRSKPPDRVYEGDQYCVQNK